MSDWTSTFAPIVGRILIGGFFLWSGIEKTLNLTIGVSFFANAGFPQPVAFALFTIVLEVIAGIALIVDIETRTAALILAIYTLISSALFFGGPSSTGAQLFLQNMAILGGLLLVSAMGGGRFGPALRK